MGLHEGPAMGGHDGVDAKRALLASEAPYFTCMFGLVGDKS